MLSVNATAVLKPTRQETQETLNEQLDELIDNEIFPLAVRYDEVEFLNNYFSHDTSEN